MLPLTEGISKSRDNNEEPVGRGGETVWAVIVQRWRTKDG